MMISAPLNFFPVGEPRLVSCPVFPVSWLGFFLIIGRVSMANDCPNGLRLGFCGRPRALARGFVTVNR
jgi:hypothetical protein